jgi:hypothetical protein
MTKLLRTPKRRAEDIDPQLAHVCKFHDQAFKYLGDVHAEKFKSLEQLVESKFNLLAERIIPLPDSLQKACMDITWVKRIGYALLFFCFSLATTGWSLVVPYASSINARLAATEGLIQVHAQKISALEATDSESKIDLKHLHDEQLSHRRNHTPPFYGTSDQGKH